MKIADREYPMRVSAAEEERIRKAGKLINERLAFYKDKLRQSDKEYLLGMVAFDCLMTLMRLEETTAAQESQLQQRLQRLDSQLQSLL